MKMEFGVTLLVQYITTIFLSVLVYIRLSREIKCYTQKLLGVKIPKV